MKKMKHLQSIIFRGFLLCSLVLPFSDGMAQTSGAFQSTNTLPYLIDSVTRSAPDLFWKIKGESLKIGTEKGFYFASLLHVSDAVNTYIHEKTTENEWVADYGEFKTIEEANAKVEELKQQMKSVFPKVDFVEYKAYMAERPDYVVVINTDKSKLFYDVRFCVSTVKKKAFGVLCIITGTKGEQSFIEYFPINTEQGSSPFASDIRMLIQESESGFSNLMGELVSDNMYKVYKATKCVDQCNECMVRKYLFGSSFVVNLGGGIPDSIINKTMGQVAMGIANALGTAYSYHRLLKDIGYGFTANDKLSQLEKPIVTVEAVKQNDSWGILIIVHQSIF
jgi:hypothetical protein